LVVLTPDAVKSDWVRRELLFALNDNRYNRRIIPLLLKNCEFSDLSWTLPSFQFADSRNDVEAGYRKLFRLWGIPFKAEWSTLKIRR
jgi:TIR domain